MRATWGDYHDFLSGTDQMTIQQRAEFLLAQPMRAVRIHGVGLFVPWVEDEGPLPVEPAHTPEEARARGRKWLEEMRMMRDDEIRRR